MVAAALALDALRRRWRLALPLLAAAFLVDAYAEAAQAGRQPRGHYRLPEHAAARQLGQLPGVGAVLDLPMQPQPVHHLRYQLIQREHGRPVLFSMVLDHLGDGTERRRIQADPVLSWFLDLMEGPTADRAAFETPHWSCLREEGFTHLVLHRQGWPPERWSRARLLLYASLGEPVIEQGRDWICWRLPGADSGG